MKLRIGIISSMVIPVPPPGYSGLEQLAYQQAEGLASLGHDVTIFAPHGSRTERAKLFMPGPAGAWEEKWHYKAYWEQLVTGTTQGWVDNFDVIIDHSWQKYAYQLKMEGTLKCPILGVFHSTLSYQHMQAPPAVPYPCMVCISKDQAEHFRNLYNREARVAYNGVDTDVYKPVPGIRRTNRFLFLARFSAIKGADLAIEACKRAGVGLDLVGDDRITGEPDYLKAIKEQCDGEQIRLVGPANRGECVLWFSRAHALLHPNLRFREPFGLAPVEAQLCGCPVIAWDFGAMPETVQHNVTGALVKSVDEMVEWINLFKAWYDHPNMANVREECRSWALRFSIENFVKRYEELCFEALKGGW